MSTTDSSELQMADVLSEERAEERSSEYAAFNERSLKVLENMSKEIGSLAEAVRQMFVCYDSTRKELYDTSQENKEILLKLLEKQDSLMDAHAQSPSHFPPTPTLTSSRMSTSAPEFVPISSTRQEEFKPVLDTINRWEASHPRTLPPVVQAGKSYTKLDTPRQKLPLFDGTDSNAWDGFILQFNRAAKRNKWEEEEKLDRFIECLRGSAVKFLSMLPQEEQDDFDTLIRHMEKRFNTKDPAGTARKKLGDLRQKTEKNEEFAEEARRLAALAYPKINLDLREELTAEAFLRGLKDSRVAYQALNQKPQTVSEALDVVTQIEHNYKATLGRDIADRQKMRRVTWGEEEEEDSDLHVNTVTRTNTIQEDIRALREMMEKMSKSVPPSTQGCFNCGDKSHFQANCPKRSISPQRGRSRSPSPKRTSNTPYSKPVYGIGKPGNGRGIQVPVFIKGHQTTGIVDTGADVTVLSTNFADKIGLEFHDSATASLLNAENNKVMDAACNIPVEIRIGKATINWPVCVAPIRDNLLLGMDILEAVDGVVMARQGDLLVQGTLVPGQERSDSQCHVARVSTDATISLPPRSETIITAKVDKPIEDLVGVLDPASLGNGAHTGSVLVGINPKIPVRLLNPTDHTIAVSKGTHLGKLVEVDKAADNNQHHSGYMDEDNNEEPKLKADVPEHLRQLIAESTHNLSKTQSEKLISLLLNFQDVFARNDEELGCFTHIKHQIPTVTSKPIKQPLRRTPLAFRNEEQEHLEKLLRNGTVVESKSDYAAPVVLVRKKDGGVRWCIDYRKINDVTEKDSFPLPNVEDCLDTLARHHKTIDLPISILHFRTKAMTNNN